MKVSVTITFINVERGNVFGDRKMLTVAQIRARIKILEEEGIPEAMQMKEDYGFCAFFKSLIIKTECD